MGWLLSLVAMAFLAEACGLLPPRAALTASPLPATATLTPTFAIPTSPPTATLPAPPTPTPVLIGLPQKGNLLFEDSFAGLGAWVYSPRGAGGLGVVAGRLKIAVQEPGVFLVALSPSGAVADFIAEVSIRPELCLEEDEFGIVFRALDFTEHYRFTLTCSGLTRVVRLHAGQEAALVPFTQSNGVFPGMGAENRLTVSASGRSLGFLINGQPVFAARDDTLPSGRLGLVARSKEGPQTTISFDDFAVYALSPSSIPEATPTPR